MSSFEDINLGLARSAITRTFARIMTNPKSLVFKRREPKLYAAHELMSLPDPEWLIDGVIHKNSFSVMYGAPGNGKTFMALDMALHIATGRPWHDMDVQHGQVIYVAAEGYASVVSRLKAWCQFYREAPPENFFMAIDPVNLTGEWASLEEFLIHLVGGTRQDEIVRGDEGDEDETVNAPPLNLVVFDTLARCAFGADENSAQDMGKIVAWLDALRDKDITGMDLAVMVVHHGAKHSYMERGSSALRGAADTMMLVKKDDYGPMLVCNKQKSAEPFDPLDFSLVQLKKGPSAGAAILVPREKVEVLSPEREEEDLSPRRAIRLGPTQLRCLRAIMEHATQDGLAVVDMSRLLNIDMPQAVRTKAALVRYGYIESQGESKKYLVTHSGLQAYERATLSPEFEREDKPILEIVD